MFSDIVQRFETSLNSLYVERDARLARGLKSLDLVSGNANRAGVVFPPSVLKQALAAGVDRARIYAPHPLGQPAAREAVRAYYRAEGLDVPASQIVMTPGTSLSYLYLFKLLANPGDEILCPRPSYPLLDSIAGLCGIKLTGYRLREGSRWEIDLASVTAGITDRTRAILMISPHNPTGAVATQAEIAALGAIAAKHQLPIISDEVFSPFLFENKVLPRPACLNAPLVFTLNGASKMFALPGLKIGWVLVTGEAGRVKQALYALDMISDTFLPVNEAAQFALPALFKKGNTFLSRYRETVQHRAETVMRLFEKAGLSYVRPEGGFYITLNLRSGRDEEEMALGLLRKEGLLLHPGYFYDMEGSHLIMSFVLPEAKLKQTLRKIVAALH